MILDGCRVPGSHLLGAEGGGFKLAMSTLDAGRIGIAAQALGIVRFRSNLHLPAALVYSVSGLRRHAARGAQGQAAFEVAVSYAQQRQAFGSPIASLQAIQLKLSEMGTRLHSAREPPRYIGMHRWQLGCILLETPAVSLLSWRPAC